jgi:hypothetical protein
MLSFIPLQRQHFQNICYTLPILAQLEALRLLLCAEILLLLENKCYY